jgi:competence protein ComEA
VLPRILLRSVRTEAGIDGAFGGIAMHPFLQETDCPSPTFSVIAIEGLRFDRLMAENRHVKIQLSFEIFAFALSCALTLGMACIAQQVPVAQTGSHAVPAPEARVDINSATPDQLMTVPGITRTWAERIIRYRPYRAKNELVDRGVVTSQVYDRIRDYIIAHRPKP